MIVYRAFQAKKLRKPRMKPRLRAQDPAADCNVVSYSHFIHEILQIKIIVATYAHESAMFHTKSYFTYNWFNATLPPCHPEAIRKMI